MWTSEMEFIDDFLRVAESINNSAHVIKEFRTGYGLPDILSIEYDKHTLKKRIRNVKSAKLRPFDIKAAYAMVYLSKRRWVKLETLRTDMSASNGSIKSLVENLVQRKMAVKKGDLIKCVPKRDIFAIRAVVAIEAKLKKWKAAIFQAQRYLWFTNNSNILIPAINSTQLKKIKDSCKKYHVGLITFSKDKTLSPIVKIRKRKPYNTYLAWLLNEVLLEETRRG